MHEYMNILLLYDDFNMTIYLKCRTNKLYEYKILTHPILQPTFSDFATIIRTQNTAAKDNKLSELLNVVPNRQNVCKIQFTFFNLHVDARLHLIYFNPPPFSRSGEYILRNTPLRNTYSTIYQNTLYENGKTERSIRQEEGGCFPRNTHVDLTIDSTYYIKYNESYGSI